MSFRRLFFQGRAKTYYLPKTPKKMLFFSKEFKNIFWPARGAEGVRGERSPSCPPL